MKPRVFSDDARTFTGLGLGGLPDAISCVVTEDLCGTLWRGGEYGLEMEYPITGRNYDLLAEQRIICALPSENATDWEPFRIYAITRPIGGVVTVKADHVSRDLRKMTCEEFELTGTTQSALTQIALGTTPTSGFNLIKTGNDYNGTYSVDKPRTTYDVLCGDECILDQYDPVDPECYTFNNFYVRLGSRGTDSDLTISYGKNMTDIEKASDMTETITGYMPFWEDDNKVIRRLPYLGYNNVVYSDNHESYFEDFVAPLDVTSIYNDNKTASASALAGKIIEYAQKELETSSVLPATINVKFLALNNTDQYKDMYSSRTVNLGDTVLVKYEVLGINERQRVIKTVYDVLAGRYISIEIGEKQIDLAGVIAKIAKRSR